MISFTNISNIAAANKNFKASSENLIELDSG